MLPAFGLYTHIRANKYRSAFLFASLFGVVHLLTYAVQLFFVAFEGRGDLSHMLSTAWDQSLSAWPFVTLATIVWVMVAYRFNSQIIDAMIGGHAITRSDEPKLYDLMETLCISRGMKAPRLEILETEVLNAFATGVNERQYSVVLTRGLIDALNEDELEAVMAHELTHIRNGDVRLMIIAMVIAGVVAFFCEMVFRLARRVRIVDRSSQRNSSSSDSSNGKGAVLAAIAIAFLIVAVVWVVSLMIRFSLSRTREFLADAGAVELTKNPDAMISALRKIDGRSEISTAPSGIMEMCFDNPRQGFADLFSTHPPIDDRIQALIDYAGGRGDEGVGENAPAMPSPIPSASPVEIR